MCLFFSLIPATVFTTLGFFVLFASTKVEGSIGKFGRILAIWIFIVATFPIIMGAYLTISGLCPCVGLLETMPHHMNP